jgi:hypothetical protein
MQKRRLINSSSRSPVPLEAQNKTNLPDTQSKTVGEPKASVAEKNTKIRDALKQTARDQVQSRWK